MTSEEIRLDDWQRILLGNISPLFLVEVFIRTLVMYLLLLAVVRWLGKRMSGQLTIMEMTVMITLGAIVSVPMQMPDRGLLQGILILIVALGLHRGINHLAYLSSKTNAVLQGKPTLVVKNGIMQLKDMQEVRISKQQLFSELRTKNVSHLGMVKRMYLEPAGSFSILQLKEPLQGLPVFPPNDDSILMVQKYTEKPFWACQNCGCLAPVNIQPCKMCSENLFVIAISS
jgi:uncharacterized membrane protein YcaP (DUF421 family)